MSQDIHQQNDKGYKYLLQGFRYIQGKTRLEIEAKAEEKLPRLLFWWIMIVIFSGVFLAKNV